jgi:hypothetical protein
VLFSLLLGRGGGVAVLEGVVQPNAKDGRYDTQPIPNSRLYLRGFSAKSQVLATPL